MSKMKFLDPLEAEKLKKQKWIQYCGTPNYRPASGLQIQVYLLRSQEIEYALYVPLFNFGGLPKFKMFKIDGIQTQHLNPGPIKDDCIKCMLYIDYKFSPSPNTKNDVII